MPTKTKTIKSLKPIETHIFLSHAAADKQLADVLADLIRLGCDVPAKRIFCTSLEGMGIPAGRQFPDFIKEKIQKPALVIALLTPSYLASEFCLCELGATWAMGHDFFPLIVKPANRSKMKGVLTGVHIEKIEDDAGLDNLRDRIIATMGCEVATALWTAKRDAFLKSLPDALDSLVIPTTVERSELDEVKASYDAALEEVASKDEEILQLSEMLEKLKSCKDSTEVSEILRSYSSEEEEFDELVDAVREAFEKLPSAVVEAFFESQHSYTPGWDLHCGGLDSNVEPGDAEAAMKRALLEYVDEGWYRLRKDHVSVSNADNALNSLRSFLDTASSDFLSYLDSEYETPLELSNRDFWDALFS